MSETKELKQVSIRAKLLAVLLLISGLGAAGSFLAVASFNHARTSLEFITGEGVPVVTAALALARDSERLNLSTAALTTSQSEEERGQRYSEIASQIEHLHSGLETLGRFNQSPEDMRVVSETAGSLEKNLVAINGLVAQNFEIKAKMQAASTLMTASRESLLSEAVREAIASSQQLALAGNSLRAAMPAEELHRAMVEIKAALKQNQPLLQIQTETESIASILNAALHAPDAEALRQMEMKLKASLKAVKNAAGSIPEALQKRILGFADGLRGAAQGQEGIPQLRLKQLDVQAKSSNLAEENKGLGKRLTKHADRLVEAAQQLIAASSSAMRMSLSQRGDWLIGGAAATLLLSLAIAFLYVGRRIVTPLLDLSSAMRKLAGGGLQTAIPGADRGDELGSMAQAVQVFKEHALKTKELEEQQAHRNAAAEAEKRAMMEDLAASFEREVMGIVTGVSSAANELEAAASALRVTAGTTETLSGSVAAASSEVSGDVNSVAAAAEQLSRSAETIGEQVKESSVIAVGAVEQAHDTDNRFAKLSQSASSIGDAVKLITDIAGRTNLLALNATIEAARAGAAGKGFAVVANEVKTLAAQTSKATEEITKQIADIQRATAESVDSMKHIGGTIARVSEIASSIAAAVEEQGGATQDISRNVQKVAKETARSADDIAKVSDGARATGAASSQVLSLAKSLSAGGGRLKQELDRFLDTVRAA